MIIELQNGGTFEGESLEEVKRKYFNYFTERGQQALSIKSIYDDSDELSSREIRDIFDELEEEIEQFNLGSEEETEGFNEIKREIMGKIYA